MEAERSDHVITTASVAIGQPDGLDVNEILFRATAQPL
jgi:hypothetical protein